MNRSTSTFLSCFTIIWWKLLYYKFWWAPPPPPLKIRPWIFETKIFLIASPLVAWRVSSKRIIKSPTVSYCLRCFVLNVRAHPESFDGHVAIAHEELIFCFKSLFRDFTSRYSCMSLKFFEMQNPLDNKPLANLPLPKKKRKRKRKISLP